MFNTFFYEPVYNLVLTFLNIVPTADLGMAIILTTLIIKLLLLPLNLKAQKGQYIMKELEGEMKGLQEKFGSDRKRYGEEIMKLYKEKNINPLSSIFLILLQIPIFFALYFVFNHNIKLEIDNIYNFVNFPENINHLAFGFLDTTQKYWWLGVLCGVSMYVYSKRQVDTMKRISEVFKKKKERENVKNKKNGDDKKEGTFGESFGESFTKNMNFQMVYFFPIMSGLAAAFLPAALGIYWTTSNLLSIYQDMYIKKKIDIEGFIKKHTV